MILNLLNNSLFFIFFIAWIYSSVNYPIFVFSNVDIQKAISGSYSEQQLLLSKSTKKFYIYDWPVIIVDRWPKNFSNDVPLSVGPGFDDNFGAGKCVDEKKGLYHTHQYSLFTLFHNRLKESPYRTNNPDEASVFFIPYDLGMDSSTRQSDGALHVTDCPMKDSVIELLHQSRYFQRSNGSDHFIIHSINQMMLYFAHMKCMDLYKVCYHCTKLSIDAYSARLFPILKRHSHLRHKWVSTPFPSNYHRSVSATEVPWDQLASENPSKRPYTFCFMGSLKVTAAKSRNFRTLIQEECLKRPHNCLLIGLKSHDSQENVFLSIPAAGMAPNSSPYDQAIFCFMPGGDFPTRKGFLDAMLAGCIPVTFQLYSAQLQWRWHWLSFEQAMLCSIYIPRQSILLPGGMQRVFDQLSSLAGNTSLINQKRRCISEVGDRMQYNIPAYSNSIQQLKSFDAVDVVLFNLLL